MPRLFTAIEIPKLIREDLAHIELGVSEALAPSLLGQLHITLQFIGEVSDSIFEKLRLRFRNVCIPRFSQKLSGVGVFEPDDRPGFLWTGISLTPELMTLREAIGVEMETVGLELETRQYKPHITLARLDAPDSALVESFLTRNNDFSTSFNVESFALYSSSRGEDGPVFEVIERFDLL